MTPRFVITHPEMGIYIGSALGLGFWSKIDGAGQTAACAFASIAEAKQLIATWDSQPEPLSFPQVEVADPAWATVDECGAAGLERWEP